MCRHCWYIYGIGLYICVGGLSFNPWSEKGLNQDFPSAAPGIGSKQALWFFPHKILLIGLNQGSPDSDLLPAPRAVGSTDFVAADFNRRGRIDGFLSSVGTTHFFDDKCVKIK
jgi:hypothetical protein